jgi:succinyl-CoA synthetase beta subunit
MCDVTCNSPHTTSGIIEAAKTIKLSVPLVVRLEGTNVEKGKQMLKDSGLNIIPASNLDDAAQKAVAAIKK